MEVQTIHVVIVAAASIVGAFGGGYTLATRKNGYVHRSECVNNIDNVYRQVREVDEKVNNVKSDTEYIRVIIDGGEK